MAHSSNSYRSKTYTCKRPPPGGSGFASVLGPTRGGVANADNSPPIWVCGGTPPTTPAMGLRPLDPPLPTPVGSGFASVLGPTRGGVANVGNSLPILVFGGTSPKPPARGLRPPGPPFCPPSWAQGSPASWAPLVAGLLMRATRSPFGFVGGHPPRPPPWGLRPLDPPLPTLVGSGFASVLGPTRGGVAREGCSLPLLILQEHSLLLGHTLTSSLF
jgi:hypothetical protein